MAFQFSAVVVVAAVVCLFFVSAFLVPREINVSRTAFIPTSCFSFSSQFYSQFFS